ncbi:hypothetical protein ACIRD3_39725 [Kitasatospora sp. NPDC093550]|uniref:hypothetical protein n=1 Tax=Kitasatospora sp. NPDC093550 TaxID=3364089 RepID=UPI0037F5E628
MAHEDLQVWRHTGAAVPATFTATDDVNPVCGHHRGSACAACAGCMSCDGCYCGEDDDYAGVREHENHLYEHEEADPACYSCELERRESADYTRCAKCGLQFPDGRFDFRKHNAPYCSALYPQPSGIDWSYLLDQDVRIVGREYAITGHVLADQPENAKTAGLRPLLYFVRADAGCEGETAPFNPREWLEVHPAPPVATT